MSELTLVIGNKNYSSWSLRPWVFMRQLNISFTEKWVSLYTNTSDSQLEQYNSDYKVPVLQDGNLVVWDSLAIMEYLSEQYLSGAGWPADVEARSVARSISAEMHSSFVHVRSEMPMNVRRHYPKFNLTPAAQHEVERIKSLWRMCRSEYGQGGEWLFGDYSIADAMFAPVVMRFVGYDVPLSGLEQDYVQSVLLQSAIKEWIEAGKAEKDVIAASEF